ncbi:MAG: hypothetical protein J6A77_06960 [Lachnospiraceae bacterium]|nr:hypothetical protein [Lachnospiraceae bacterium]
MSQKNGKEIRSTVKVDTSYGRKVLTCVERLKDRTGLTISQLIQEALISYERATREEGEVENVEKEQLMKTEISPVKNEESPKNVVSSANNLLRLSGGDMVDY